MLYLLTGLCASMFYFSFGFTFLPSGINTKVILAILGGLMAIYHAVQNKEIKVDRILLGAFAFAIAFSLICFISADYNHTTDTSYATYFVSFIVWIFAAYAVCTMIRGIHGEVNLLILTSYLAAISAGQCILALLINTFPALQHLVDSYINQGQEFLQETQRLYGIGASLDNAGVRFSIVLIMIAAILAQEESILSRSWKITLFLSAFFLIGVIGNMISRTTSIGVGIALLYFMWNTGILRMIISPIYFRFHLLFVLILVSASLITAYFYNSNQIFHDQIRFAFEGFFNWVEQGEWRTDSTDKLNRNMWIWPDNINVWLIGTGLFADWVFGTDIGYCRFIMYCGLTGFAVFALFFIYNAAVFAKIYKSYRGMFFSLMVLSFIIWIKVSTDIFLTYALFYCMDMFRSNTFLSFQNENRLLYTRHV